MALESAEVSFVDTKNSTGKEILYFFDIRLRMDPQTAAEKIKDLLLSYQMKTGIVSSDGIIVAVDLSLMKAKNFLLNPKTFDLSSHIPLKMPELFNGIRTHRKDIFQRDNKKRPVH
jgi:hypothetical protein